MSQVSEQEEYARFLIAMAAIDEVGGEKDIEATTALGGIVPFERRQYLYARPAGDGVQFSIERLVSVLKKTDQPHLVDWRKSAEERGLRYVSSVLPVADEVREFMGREARAEWAEWREGQNEHSSALIAAALRGSDQVNDVEETSVPAVAEPRSSVEKRIRAWAAKEAERNRAGDGGSLEEESTGSASVRARPRGAER